MSREVLAELKRRGVIRSGNAPAGDYAELLVQLAAGGKLAPNSQRSWDVQLPGGTRIQVKARVVTNPRSRGERQLSVFRSWDFDAAMVVLFDDGFDVWKAALLPVDAVREASREAPYVRGARVIATDDLLARGEDWTDRIRQAIP